MHVVMVSAEKEESPANFDDTLFDYLAGTNADVPVVFVYESGGHGYGLRPTNQPVTTWPARMEDWMRHKGLLKN